MTNPFDNLRSLRALGLAVLVVALLPACRGMRTGNTPIHLNPNMDNVTYVGPQEPAGFFQDGRGMRPQVDGTVAVGELRADAHLYEGKDARGNWATTLPDGLELSHELVDRGRDRFGIYCTPCHGEAGLENGGVVPQRAAALGTAWAIPSLHGERQRGYAVGQLYDIISNGFNTMPGYAAQVPVEDRWAIATYVRALQVSYEMPLAELPREIATEQGWR